MASSNDLISANENLDVVGSSRMDAEGLRGGPLDSDVYVAEGVEAGDSESGREVEAALASCSVLPCRCTVLRGGVG